MIQFCLGEEEQRSSDTRADIHLVLAALRD
jgi:hypothetical protein